MPDIEVDQLEDIINHLWKEPSCFGWFWRLHHLLLGVRDVAPPLVGRVVGPPAPEVGPGVGPLVPAVDGVELSVSVISAG